MSAVLLLLASNFLPKCLALICNYGVSNTFMPINDELSSCNGTVCFVAVYIFKYPQYMGHRAYEMGCFSFPYTFPSGCRKNEKDNVLCICGEDYCNDEGLLGNTSKVAAIKDLTCTQLNMWFPLDSTTCKGTMCQREFGDSDWDYQFCYDDFYILTSFDLFYFGDDSLLWPTESCIQVNWSGEFRGGVEVCTYPYQYNSTKRHPLRKKVKCRSSFVYPTETCTSELCFVGENFNGDVSIGCVQQTNPEGIRLMPGFFNFHASWMFVCNSTMCNDNFDPRGASREAGWTIPQGEDIEGSGGIDTSCCLRPIKKDSNGLHLSLLVAVALWT